MDVVLGLFRLPGVLVGFGERVYTNGWSVRDVDASNNKEAGREKEVTLKKPGVLRHTCQIYTVMACEVV